jgi:hypothetical protein
MSEFAAPARQQAAPQPGSKNELRLQRKCACGRHSADGAECGACAKQRASLQRWSASRPSPAAMLRTAGQAERAGAAEDGRRRGRDFIRVDLREPAARDGRGADLQWTTGALADTVAGNGAASRFGGSSAGRRGPARLRDTYPSESRGGLADAKSIIQPNLPGAAEGPRQDLGPEIPVSATGAAAEARSPAGDAAITAPGRSAVVAPASLASAPASAATPTPTAAAVPARPPARTARTAEVAEQRPEAEEPRMEEDVASPAPPLRALIFDEGTQEPRPGQMGRTEFLARLQAEVTRAAEEALVGTGRTTDGCPYLGFWFGYYRRRDSRQIERALHRYAPEAAGAETAAEYIAPVVARVRRAVDTWARTGEVTGVPPGLAAEGARLAGPAARESAGGSGHVFRVVQLKAREGGARAAEDPEAIQAELGQGRPLDGGVRTRMEAAFGNGLGPVHLHTGATASRVASGLNARAFTVGRHVAFGAGEYRPGTPAGDALIAHEVAHVVQQRSGAATEAPLAAGSARYGALERDADHAAAGAVTSLWGGAKEAARQAAPALRSGLRLQRCSTFSEHASERYQGYDSSTEPNGLVVPVGGARKVEVDEKDELTLVSHDPDVATVDATTPPEGMTVTGVSHGYTWIEARAGRRVRERLRVSSKRQKTVKVDYHYMSDSAGHRTARSPGAETALTEKLNDVWELQANVHFATRIVDSPTVSLPLGDGVDAERASDAEYQAVTAFATAGAYNVFLVWEIQDTDGDIQGVTADTGGHTLLEDNECSDLLTLPHEAGHFLGLDHTDDSLMASCGSRDDGPRVRKSEADIVNP